jgi:hypothetical protein
MFSYSLFLVCLSLFNIQIKWFEVNDLNMKCPSFKIFPEENLKGRFTVL